MFAPDFSESITHRCKSSIETFENLTFLNTSVVISKMVSKKLLPLLAFAVVGFGLSLQSCKKEADKITKVYGVITLENAEEWATWKDSGEVQVTLFPQFSLDPLAGWGAVPDNFFGPNIPGGTFAVGAPYNSQNPLILTYEPGKTQYSYEIELEPGTYSALALGFRHNLVTDPSKKTATLGVHWDTPAQVSHGIVIRIRTPSGAIVPVFNFPAPTTFTLTEGEQKEINFKADFGFVNQWY